MNNELFILSSVIVVIIVAAAVVNVTMDFVQPTIIMWDTGGLRNDSRSKAHMMLFI